MNTDNVVNRTSLSSRGTFNPARPQDVNFWLSLKRALEGIEAQLKSEEVRMVMDALRNATRFHVTVSFTAGTGLRDATDLGGSLPFFFEVNELMHTGSATD